MSILVEKKTINSSKIPSNYSNMSTMSKDVGKVNIMVDESTEKLFMKSAFAPFTD